jgi:predicted aldo/keto reductase-like oxidoreductase
VHYRKFGKLDWKASALGFGAMRLPVTDKDPSHIDKPEAIRMIRYAIDHGVNYLDTAYMYHAGESERLVGEALQKGYREKVKLVTKLPVNIVNSVQEADRILQDQLNKLQTSRIDFYLFHGLNGGTWNKVKELGLIQWAEEKMTEGLFGYLGFSFHDEFPVFKEIIDAYDNWVLAQVQYNYIDVYRQAGIRGVKYAAGKGLAVVVMEPIRGGTLAKKPPEAITRVWDTAPSYRTMAEWALMWVWNQPEISLALSGMSTMEQVTENVGIAGRSGIGMLNSSELDLLDRIRETYKSLYPVPCTKCRYCMPCPNKVEIPAIFELFNDSMAFDVPDLGRFRYNSPFGALKEDQRADKCVECGQCEEACPQKIPIREWLKKVHQELSQPAPPPR